MHSSSRWRVTSSLLWSVPLVLWGWGCQSSAQSARFAAPVELTTRVVQSVLTEVSGVAPVEERSGRLRSEWKAEPSDSQQGLLLSQNYLRRVRYCVSVTGSEGWSDVKVVTELQERPPAGRRAYRWTRVLSKEHGREILVRIGQALRESLKESAEQPTTTVGTSEEGGE